MLLGAFPFEHSTSSAADEQRAFNEVHFEQIRIHWTENERNRDIVQARAPVPARLPMRAELGRLMALCLVPVCLTSAAPGSTRPARASTILSTRGSHVRLNTNAEAARVAAAHSPVHTLPCSQEVLQQHWHRLAGRRHGHGMYADVC